MTRAIRVFVNAVPVDASEGATALECVRAWRADEAAAVVAGTRLITDSRGLPIAADSPASAGSIYRTVANRGRASDVT
ncbi:MAG TPA: hypothetical protein VKH19_15330 [Gemmatimonadaceae bacterium]|nr:hypothetical protein [Gemmatimonadaceae bacterium]